MSNSIAICPMERWSGKESDSAIGDALFGTDILSSQHNTSGTRKNHLPESHTHAPALCTSLWSPRVGEAVAEGGASACTSAKYSNSNR